ncbi:hypothetical protein P9112_002948 [Eukaryota sp. TZLM1-RC]
MDYITAALFVPIIQVLNLACLTILSYSNDDTQLIKMISHLAGEKLSYRLFLCFNSFVFVLNLGVNHEILFRLSKRVSSSATNSHREYRYHLWYFGQSVIPKLSFPFLLALSVFDNDSYDILHDYLVYLLVVPGYLQITIVTYVLTQCSKDSPSFTSKVTPTSLRIKRYLTLLLLSSGIIYLISSCFIDTRHPRDCPAYTISSLGQWGVWLAGFFWHGSWYFELKVLNRV